VSTTLLKFTPVIRKRDSFANDEEWLAGHFRAYQARRRLVHRYAFAVPSPEALALVAQSSPLIQIGAGTGYWAWLLRRDYGADILPYDIHPPREGQNFWFRREWVPILEGREDQAAAHPDRTLFLCWPPMTDMAATCLRVYRGARVIVIGEGPGGCTGDEAFYDVLDTEWDELATLDLPQWDGIHDYLAVYHRKPLTSLVGDL
jgi:hypothetical protein